MNALRRTFASALVAVLFATPASASLWQGSNVHGQVTEAATGQPVLEALVILRGTGHRALTDRDGRFDFEEVEAGSYLLEVEHIAYLTRADTIVVRPGNDVVIGITLAASAIPLRPIEVVARPRKLVLVGFFDRMSRGIGTYFTREDVEASRVQRISDLLSRVPGLRRSMSSDGRSQISMRGVKSITQRCDTQYFIDGVQADIGPLGVDVVPARDIAGIEIYRGSSELPIQFDVGRAGCGAILIWTRAGS
ncbi:MAG: carboxypeptidase regulatory-like domain-containing protein [Longimicrobiales bacterium]